MAASVAPVESAAAAERQADPRANRESWQQPLFAGTLMLSAFLLFVIQPLTGRLVLPVLGGSAAVWTTSLVFFQSMLVAGYAWAHFSRALTIRAQVLVQVALLAAAAWMFPANLVAVDTPETPTVGALVKVLVLLVGLPAFAVAVNGSLLQRWFAHTRARGAADPAFLYAFSNIGSFGGLLAYPVVVERVLGVTHQRILWGAACAVLATLVALCGWSLRAQSGARTDAQLAGGTPLSYGVRLQWLVLGLVPASLLAGVTAYLSTELLPMPLLWVVPLAIYLATFVTSFGGRILRLDSRFVSAVPLVLVALIFWQLRGGAPLWAALGAHLLVFGVVAALCHGRLAASRPGPARLTEFYLLIAVGGAIGGAINALLAPAMFTTAAEYPLMLIGAAIVLAFLGRVTTGPFGYVFGALIVVTVASTLQASRATPALAIAPLLLVIASSSLRPLFRTVLACALLLVTGKTLVSGPPQRALTARSVFAALRVVDDWHPGLRALVHGSTVHGLQAQDAEGRYRPRSYYSPEGPVGQLVAAAAPQLAGADVGVIGLGAGELAAYGTEGQRWTFFDIDPEVVRIASNPALFTYVRDTRADLRIVLGDGRRSILRENPDARFGLLVLDAFTSDAVPIHLLTVEAFQTYEARLASPGIIAVHISNRFVDLRPVLAAAARELGFEARWRNDTRPEDRQTGRYPSQWFVLGRPGSIPDAVLQDAAWRPVAELGRPIRWTDERATLLDVLK